MSHATEIEILLEAFIANTIDKTQLARLRELLHDEALSETAAAAIGKILAEEKLRPVTEHNLQAMFQQIVQTGATSRVRRMSSPGRWWIAASILLIATAITVFFIWSSDRHRTAYADRPVMNPADIEPGKDGAVLTLSDGSQIILDSLDNGVIAVQNGAQIAIQNGGIVYAANGESAGEPMYNTITTPKGRQFLVVLPDGTKVWLNAASGIRYPTVFNGKQRKVEVRGEAYFEVAKNTRMPFRVNVNNKASIEVLGTHFNVNAYENEETINTTLLEGSVRVLAVPNFEQKNEIPQPANKHLQKLSKDQILNGTTDTLIEVRKPAFPRSMPSVILQPGQQAQVVSTPSNKNKTSASQEIAVMDNADIDKVMAWRNGLFIFEDATLDGIMRQLERWYDIEVVYENGIPKLELAGKISRDVSLNGLLTGLRDLGMKSRLEGRKLIVSP